MGSRAACRECARRSWLLGRLSARLHWRSRDESRLFELLELDDDELIDAIGGRRRQELRRAWKLFESGEPGAPERARCVQADGRGTPVQTVCRHDSSYPGELRCWAGAPRMLHVLGGTERLARLTAEPAVAIVGTASPTDYGLELARSLARGLSVSGVTVIGAFAHGISAAALAGVLETDRPALAVMAGGVDTVTPADRRGCHERVLRHGCAIAELPCGQPAGRWSALARMRTVVGLARLTIVVEAGEDPSELRPARIARELGRTVAAVPGRVTSPASAGSNLLLREGAPLVRGAEDALELLYGLDPRECADRKSGAGWRPGASKPEMPGLAQPERHLREACAGEAEPGAPALERRLRMVLERVGAGHDTPGKLTGPGEDAGEVLLALAELEVMGLLARGDGGRYVPRESLAAIRA